MPDTSVEPTDTIVPEPIEFWLSLEQWEAFCQRLGEPPKVIPALQRLFSEPELY